MRIWKIYLFPTKINRALDGDTAVQIHRIKVVDIKVKLKGRYNRIREAFSNSSLGTYSEARHFGFVIPDDKRIMQNLHS